METPPRALTWLAAAKTHEQLVSAIWDLRDSAYDEPPLWTGLTAEDLFQCLAEELEQGPGRDGAVVPGRALANALEKALAANERQ